MKKETDTKSKGHGWRLQTNKPYMLISRSGLVFHARLFGVGYNGKNKIAIFTNIR